MPRKKRRTRRTRSISRTAKHLFHPRASNNHRPKILHPEAILYFCLIVLASFALVRAFRYFPQFEQMVLGYASNINADQVLIQTNEERVSQELPELTISDELSQAALAKGQDMFADQYWSHTAPDGIEPWYFIEEAGYAYKVAGENLARDFMNTSDMLEAWMASPTHKANIMNPKFQEIGIAVINGKLNGFETTLVVQMFGTPSTSALAERPLRENIQQFADQFEQQAEESVSRTGTPEQVLAAGDVLSPVSFRDSVLFTPLQLTKAFFLAVIILVIATLLYDTFVIGNRNATRLVGKNLGHLMVLGAVAFMLVFFKGGVVN